jgi:hypothetical protein
MLEQALHYQFTVFVADGETVAQADLLGLRTRFDGVPDHFQVTTLTWPGVANIWKMVWSQVRIDLTFDARVHQEVTENSSPPSVSDVAQRITNELKQLGSWLDLRVNRVALIITGESSSENPPAPLTAVRLFSLPSDVIAEAESGAVLDATLRLNRTTHWRLDGKDVWINRIELANAASGPYAPPPSNNRIVWQLDLNTDSTEEELTQEAVADFFRLAAAEADHRLGKVNDVAMA